MLPKPRFPAESASAPRVEGSRPAIVVHAELDAESIPVRRLAPAGLSSAMLHLALLGLFILIAPRSEAVTPVEIEQPNPIFAEDTFDTDRPDFLAVDAADSRIGDASQTNYDVPRLGEVSIPGEVRPDEQIGSMLATSDSPASLPPPAGFGDRGDAGTRVLGDGDAIVGAGVGGRFGPSVLGGPRGKSAVTQQQLKSVGISGQSEAAVAKGLGWLARVQSPNGAWKLDGNFPDKGSSNDVAGTALGLLPFLAAGKTHRPHKNNPYDTVVKKALDYLIGVQNKAMGTFSRDMYAHGLASIAVTEAFALSGDYGLKKPAQLAINAIVALQHDRGGWRYTPGQSGDTSVSGWQIMALKSAMMAGLDVPPTTLKKAVAFLDSVVDPATEGSGYTGPQPTPTMTAVSLLCRQYLSGWGPKNLRYLKAVDTIIKPNRPRPEFKDVYYTYYATQVMHHLGGDDWKVWNTAMRDQLVASQHDDRKDPSRWGSWSPAGDRWGQTGGRLMVTSLNLLTLEVYYRYLPLYYRGPTGELLREW